MREFALGSSQSGLRDHNARLVLSVIRRHGALASAEIARRSGLSAQTVSNIIRALESDGLLMRRPSVRGRVGKPSVPVALNPEGACSLGLNIGRRSAELVLVDFDGRRIDGCTTTYRYPDVDGVFTFLRDGLARICPAGSGRHGKVVGLGLARPNRIWSWLENVKAPADAMRAWQDIVPEAAIRELTGLDVFVENDATSACVAEHLQGRGSEFSDFAYVFVGAFVGGGLVVNGKVVSGKTLNTAALGPMPVPDGAGGVTQLLNVASLHVLEAMLAEAGQDPLLLRRSEDWSRFEPCLGPWIEKTGANLAIAAAAIASIVEVEAILIDGAMPVPVRARLTDAINRHVSGLDVTGLDSIRIEEAAVGMGARSIGAALLPIHARYFLG